MSFTSLRSAWNLNFIGIRRVFLRPSTWSPNLNWGVKSFSTTNPGLITYQGRKKPSHWLSYNEKMYPPQEIEEAPRPAYICHMMENIKYSEDKLWYVACLVRGMQIDEAIRQLDYVKKKGAYYVKQTLLEAQELAVKRENVEFKSNLWVAESNSTKGAVIKGIRRHARGRVGIIHYRHCHYFVRLEEGSPPKDYYPPDPDGPTLLTRWIQEQREQRIHASI